jgi:polyadenylate-binding protein
LTLYDIYSKAGIVLSICICKDNARGKSLGYAYVNCKYYLDALSALDTFNFEIIFGRPIRVMWSQRNPTKRQSGVGNVFVKNLHKSINSKAFYDAFSVYGDILSSKLVCDRKRSKGYGYVHFENEGCSDFEISSLDGIMWNGQVIHVCKFENKHKRQNNKSFDVY